MQAGNLVSSDVQAFTSRVLVNGVERPVNSWSVDRELTGDLPAQIVAVSGVTQATGSIEFASEQDITESGINPWNRSTGWLPKSGDRVDIYAGDSVTEWKQFTGAIDRITGSIGSGFQATIIDDYDKLSVSISHVPLLRVMPPLSDGGEYRAAGLSSIYFVDYAARAAGFHCTPKPEYDAAWSAPLQGSLWPNRGTLTAGLVGGVDSGPWASITPAPWGVSMGDFQNTYTPRRSELATVPLQVTLMVAADHAGNTTLNTYFGATDNVSLAVAGSRTVTARLNGTDVTSIVMGSATVVTLLIKAGAWTLKTNKGATATGTRTMPTGVTMDRIIFTADINSHVAGAQISHPDTASREFAALNETPTAILDYSNTQHSGIIDASPTIENRAASDLLEEIGAATLTSVWIDESGVFRCAPSIALRSRTPVRTVTTLDSILSLDWDDSLLGQRSSVTVQYRELAISSGKYQNKILFQGSGETLESTEILEEFVEPGANEDWIMPDESMIILSSANWATYNSRRGTMGGVFYSSTDGSTTSDTGLSTTITMDKLGISRYKIKHVAGSFPAGVTANLGTSPTDTALWERLRDKPLPVVRGYAKVEGAQSNRPPIITGAKGPELTHDAGPWNSRTDSTIVVDRIGSFIADQTANPKPTITGLSITPDPRLQLGDVITISSPDLMGVTMTALVVGVSSSFGSSYEQSLTVRIINVTTTYTSYAEYDASLGGSNLTYAQWQALGPIPQTYTQFNNS